MIIDSLQFFDEEYTRFNEAISQINSTVIHSKDIYNNLVAAQKELIKRISNTPINFSSLESFMQYIKDFIKNSEELLVILKDLHSAFALLQGETNGQ